MIIVFIMPAPKLPRVVPFSDGRVVNISPEMAEVLSRLMDEVDKSEVRAGVKLVYERIRRISQEFPILSPRQDDPVRLLVFMDGPAARLAPAGSPAGDASVSVPTQSVPVWASSEAVALATWLSALLALFSLILAVVVMAKDQGSAPAPVQIQIVIVPPGNTASIAPVTNTKHPADG